MSVLAHSRTGQKLPQEAIQTVQKILRPRKKLLGKSRLKHPLKAPQSKADGASKDDLLLIVSQDTATDPNTDSFRNALQDGGE